jgi:hypothetical protein
MIRTFLFVFLLMPAIYSHAQGMFGMEAGVGQSTVKTSYKTPVLKGYYLHKLSRTFFTGGTLSYERYSFQEKYNVPPATGSNEAVISIRQKTGYLYLSPTADMGIGYRKYLHVHAIFGLGIFTNGKQTSNKYEQYVSTPPIGTAYDTATYITTQNVPRLASHYAMGFSWRIPTGGYWNIILTSQYTHIPTNLTNYGPVLKTDYVSFTIGIMHKYPMVLVEY